MIVGEAPGKTEEAEGLPFIGDSGKLLREALEDNEVDPSQMYITNVVKYRPTKESGATRAPSDDEIKDGLPYLIEEVQRVVPRYILALGNIAFQTLVGTDMKIMLYRGYWRRLDEAFDWDEALVLPTFHPAAVLYNRKLMETFQRDIAEFAKVWKAGLDG